MRLTIQYADPDTTPSRYPSHGWLKADTVMPAPDTWVINGQDWALRAHVTQAQADGNVIAYSLNAPQVSIADFYAAIREDQR